MELKITLGWGFLYSGISVQFEWMSQSSGEAVQVSLVVVLVTKLVKDLSCDVLSGIGPVIAAFLESPMEAQEPGCGGCRVQVYPCPKGQKTQKT